MLVLWFFSLLFISDALAYIFYPTLWSLTWGMFSFSYQFIFNIVIV